MTWFLSVVEDVDVIQAARQSSSGTPFAILRRKFKTVGSGLYAFLGSASCSKQSRIYVEPTAYKQTIFAHTVGQFQLSGMVELKYSQNVHFLIISTKE